MSVVLISTYDLGRQPFGLASPAAWLRGAGFDVTPCDLSRDRLQDETVDRAALVAFHLPMHTATRLALPVIDRIVQRHPTLPVCAYGLYAPLNEALLRGHGVSHILGPEAERDLVELAAGSTSRVSSRHLPRLQFITPDRTGLPDLTRYATLQMPDGTRRIAGATEATRGCKHRCRHCPIVPIYDGAFRVVPLEIVMADIDQQVAAGAEHVTFGDPDFFNGPAHARRVVEALHARHPHLSYDVTIKVEHLLRHRELVPVLAQTGCAFVTSAVESVDDRILEKFDKRHTRADFETVVALTREAGLALTPTFVAFTPWTTVEGYRDLLDAVEQLELVDHVAPVQWALRLLVTHGSRLLELDDIGALVGPFNPRTLTYPWQHPDPRVDRLQAAVAQLVGVRLTQPREELFHAVRALAEAHTDRTTEDPPARVDEHAVTRVATPPRIARAAIPYLNEPWYC